MKQIFFTKLTLNTSYEAWCIILPSFLKIIRAILADETRPFVSVKDLENKYTFDFLSKIHSKYN